MYNTRKEEEQEVKNESRPSTGVHIYAHCVCTMSAVKTGGSCLCLWSFRNLTDLPLQSFTISNLKQDLCQDLETGCSKLAIEKVGASYSSK